MGAKGLSASHVIVLGLNNYIIPENPYEIDDDEICKFIVALTRARRSCMLVTYKEFNQRIGKTAGKPSVFIDMLPKEAKLCKEYKIQSGRLVGKSK